MYPRAARSPAARAGLESVGTVHDAEAQRPALTVTGTAPKTMTKATAAPRPRRLIRARIRRVEHTSGCRAQVCTCALGHAGLCSARPRRRASLARRRSALSPSAGLAREPQHELALLGVDRRPPLPRARVCPSPPPERAVPADEVS